MNAIVEQLTTWMVEHTYLVVFLVSLIDAAAIPFPGRLVLAAAGALAGAGHASVILIVAISTAGVVIMDHVWYFGGPLGGDRLLRLYCRVTFSSPDCAERAASWFQRYGRLVIVVGRFIAAVRVLTWPSARAHGVGYPTFLALDVPTALVWTAKWIVLGWLLGDHWTQASSEVRWVTVAVGGVAILAFFLVRLWRRRAARDGRSPGRDDATAPRESAALASRESPAAPRARPHP